MPDEDELNDTEQVTENAVGATPDTAIKNYSTKKTEFNTNKDELIKAIDELILLISEDQGKIDSLNAEKATLESINLATGGGRRSRRSRRRRRPRKSRRSRRHH
jgi:hypothetical protein